MPFVNNLAAVTNTLTDVTNTLTAVTDTMIAVCTAASTVQVLTSGVHAATATTSAAAIISGIILLFAVWCCSLQEIINCWGVDRTLIDRADSEYFVCSSNS